MHSEWIKVAVAAGRNGSVPAWRTASQQVLANLQDFAPAGPLGLDGQRANMSMALTKTTRLTQAIIETALYLANYSTESTSAETRNGIVLPRASGDHGGTMDTWFSTYEYRLALRGRSAGLSAAVSIIAILVVIIQFMLYLTLLSIYSRNSDLKPLIYNMIKEPGQEQATNPYREYVFLELPDDSDEGRSVGPNLRHVLKGRPDEVSV